MEEKKKEDYYKKIMTKVLIVSFILVGIFLAFKVAIFYMPFIIAILIATLMEPLIRFFMKRCKLKRGIAVTISLILIVLIIGTLLTLLISSLITESMSLISNLNEYYDDAYSIGIKMFNDLKNGQLGISKEIFSVAEKSLEGILGGIQSFLFNFFTGLINTLTSIPTWITYGIITLLAIIFICFDREYIKHLYQKHIPTAWRNKISDVIQETCSVSFNYIKAEAKLSFLCFILVSIGLAIINSFIVDIPYAAIMSVLIGFVDLLPLFGAGAVMLPWAVYLYFTGNIPLAIGVIIIWIAWAIIKQFIEPKFVSHEMGMHPIFTLFGMYTGFRLFGVIGLLLGPILLLIIKNVFKEFIDKGIFKNFFELE